MLRHHLPVVQAYSRLERPLPLRRLLGQGHLAGRRHPLEHLGGRRARRRRGLCVVGMSMCSSSRSRHESLEESPGVLECVCYLENSLNRGKSFGWKGLVVVRSGFVSSLLCITYSSLLHRYRTTNLSLYFLCLSSSSSSFFLSSCLWIYTCFDGMAWRGSQSLIATYAFSLSRSHRTTINRYCFGFPVLFASVLAGAETSTSERKTQILLFLHSFCRGNLEQ